MPNVYFAPGGASADLGTTTDKWDKVYANSIYGDVLNADGTPKYAPASGGGGGGGGGTGDCLWVYDDNSASLQPKDLEDLTPSDLNTEEATLREIVADVVDEKLEYVPIGVVLPFMGNGAIPSGYLLCDGSAVSRTMYPDLFTAIGTTYGSGDGSTTFNLPDSNQAKRFLQGDTVAGTVKSAGLPNIEGDMALRPYRMSYSGALYMMSPPSTISAASGDGGSVCDGYLRFDASRSNPIYGNSTTVQPNALTTRYIIKAFDGQTADSALVDITQYANELAGKISRRELYEDNFTIIYPNSGTEESPANVTANTRYVETNPFSGYYVRCVAEVLYNGAWGNPEWSCMMSSNSNITYGVRANEYNGSIVLRTGSNGILRSSSTDDGGGPAVVPSSQQTLPCRVKVWKIGKIPT